MTERTERKKPPRKSPTKLVRPSRPARAAMKSDAPALPPVRPVVAEGSVFLLDMERRARDVASEISLIDATEARSQADFDQRVETERGRFERWLLAETSTRQAEHDGQTARREELQQIFDGCAAAISASRANRAPAADAQGALEKAS